MLCKKGKILLHFRLHIVTQDDLLLQFLLVILSKMHTFEKNVFFFDVSYNKKYQRLTFLILTKNCPLFRTLLLLVKQY